jgi:hypothetical protein
MPTSTGESAMKFLCLAYGDEAGWKALGADEQAALLAWMR